MVLNQDFKLIKSPPIWFWIVVFLISFTGMFYLGIVPNAIENMSKPIAYPEQFNLFDRAYHVLSLRWYLVLVGFNVVMSLIAIFYIAINLAKLKQRADSEMIGYKFTWSFLKIIPVLVLVPMLSFYFFSFGSIQDNVENAEIQFENFNLTIAAEVDELYKNTQDFTNQYYENQTKNIGEFIGFVTNEGQRPFFADALVIKKWACSIKIFDLKMKPKSTAKSDIKCGKDGYSYTGENFSIITNFESDIVVSSLTNRMKRLKNAEIKLSVNSNIINTRFIIDFSSTVLLTVLSALLVVFKMIDDLMRPLNNLSLATREISKGNYDVLVHKQTDDGDVSGLIEHFNEMSKRIKSSREGLDTHNLYLETILKYSYGVIGLDKDRKIQFINPIIEKMLEIKNKDSYIGLECKEILDDQPYLQTLFELTEYKFRQKLNEWTEDIELSLPKKAVLLSCQGAILKADKGVLGYVIVINDISELHRAQKSAAWGEVAVRMAHEIKNPLTPILLSAQRLRNRFLDSLQNKDLEVVDKTTSTIIDQVKSLDDMVSSFAEYANTPKIEKRYNDLNKIITKSVSLYDVISDATINLNLSTDIPKILLDIGSIDRVIINLIKNSCEAIKLDQHSEINISTEYLSKINIVRLCVQDDGVGFDKEIIEKVFEPYVSTKTEGTGLGMAIVQSILDEHGATISAKNVKPHGALITIEFNCDMV
jgi:hypothetical protein